MKNLNCKSSWRFVEVVQEVYWYCKNCGASRDKRIENFRECFCPDHGDDARTRYGHTYYHCGICGQQDPEYISAVAERLIRKL